MFIEIGPCIQILSPENPQNSGPTSVTRKPDLRNESTNQSKGKYNIILESNLIDLWGLVTVELVVQNLGVLKPNVTHALARRVVDDLSENPREAEKRFYTRILTQNFLFWWFFIKEGTTL